MSTAFVRRSVDPPLNTRTYPVSPYENNPPFLPGGLTSFNYQLLGRNTHYTQKVVLSKNLRRAAKSMR